jgi:phospholipid transport system substrate-binding protein
MALATAATIAAVPVRAEATPDVLVRETTEQILVVLRENNAKYQKDRTALYAMVDERVLPHFDFRKMAQWVLGLSWRQASEAQRAQFTEEFRKLLVRTYATALLKYTDQTIIFLPYTGKPDDRIVVVKTEIKQAGGGANIPLYYTFYNARPGWKVFDLTVEGVSLVTNYRKVYGERLQTESLDSLIASLAETNRKAESGSK